MAFEPSTMELPLLEPQDPRPTTPTLPPPPAARLTPIRRYQHWWAELGRDTWTDIRHVKSGDGILWVPLYVFSTIIVHLGVLVFTERLSLTPTSMYPTGGLGCHPDGSFGYESDYDRWSISGFFQITIRSGYLSFTQAKIIDITWDVVIGRVGQSVMAYYSWQAFSSYVRVSMETGPVTFDTFFATHLEETASLKSTVKMVRDFSTRRRLRSRPAMAFIIATMIYILAWPTIAGAMTGYTSAESAFVSDIRGSLTPLEKFLPVSYVIHDGWRVDLEGDYLVTYRFNSKPDEECTRAYFDGPCGNELTEDVTLYIEKYGLLGITPDSGVNNDETEWKGKFLGPALNISVSQASSARQNYTKYPSGWPGFSESWSFSMIFTTIDYNRSYSYEYLENNGTCQTLKDYQWGFSFLQLFVDMLLLLAWAIGIWVLWLEAHSELRRKEIEASNRYRSVLDLATALNKDMATIGESADAISNQQLARLVKTRLHGVAVKAVDPVPSARYTYWTWIKERKGWVGVYVLTATWVVPWFLVNFLVVGTSISVALSVGRASKTKVFLFISVFIASSLLLFPFMFGGAWGYIIDPIGLLYSGPWY